MTEQEIYNAFIREGMTPAGACGMMGNLYAESGLKFNVLENLCRKRLRDAGKGDYTNESYTAAVDSGKISKAEFLHPLPNRVFGYGICQWTTTGRKARLYDLVKHLGVSIADPDTQIDYLITELKTSYRNVWAVLTATGNIREASDIVLDRFECPADRSESVRLKRCRYGMTYYDKYANASLPEPDASSGWRRDENGWWYRYADGTYPKNQWAWLREEIGGTCGWYHFDADGYMQTGHQVIDGKHYFLWAEKDNREGQCAVTDAKGALMLTDDYDFQTGTYKGVT